MVIIIEKITKVSLDLMSRIYDIHTVCMSSLAPGKLWGVGEGQLVMCLEIKYALLNYMWG